MTSDDACERVACKALCSAWCRRGRFLPKPHTHQAHAHPRPTHTLSTTPTGKTTRSACLAANALSLNSIRERCCPTSPEHPPTRFERLLPWLRSNYDGRCSSKRSRRRGRSDCRHGSAPTCRLAGRCGCKCGRRSVERPTIEIDRSPPLTPPLPSPFWSSISHRWTTTTTRMRTTRRSGARP
jgi:hypothetical protein